MELLNILIYSLLGLSILVFFIGWIVERRRKKRERATYNKVGTIRPEEPASNLPPISEISEPKKVTFMDKVEAKFTFSKAPKKYYLIQKVTPIGTSLRFGEKFHAGLIEEKGKLWLQNLDYGFFVEKPDDRSLTIIDNQEGFIYKNINSQWLLQGYNLANGQGNNIYTVDEQSDFLRTLEAKYWQYQGKKNLNKDKWSFWGLVVLGLLIIFSMGMNAYQTNKFMSNVDEIINNDVLDETDKALMLEVIRNQEKLSRENIELITTIKEKGLNIQDTANKNSEGVVFK